MRQRHARRRRHPFNGSAPAREQAALLVVFFALTFLAAWSLWIAAAALTAATAWSVGARALFFLPGTFAPGAVAIWLTLRNDGAAAMRALAARVFDWHVGARWYVFAVGYVAGVKLTVAVVHRFVTGAWPAFGDVPLYVVFAAVAFSTAFQAGEEIGWRGYALPRLSSGMGLGRASVLLGIIWALWHLPLFFIAETSTTGQPFLPYLLGVTALSVAMAWLYGHTRGSLLLMMIMHAAINNTKDLVPSGAREPVNPFVPDTSLVSWLTIALLWVGAAYFLTRMPPPPPGTETMSPIGSRALA